MRRPFTLFQTPKTALEVVVLLIVVLVIVLIVLLVVLVVVLAVLAVLAIVIAVVVLVILVVLVIVGHNISLLLVFSYRSSMSEYLLKYASQLWNFLEIFYFHYINYHTVSSASPETA